MERSNISYISNVNICNGTFNTRKGDAEFLSKINDYYALDKLRILQGGNTNSAYYLFKYEQLKILSPDFSGMFIAAQRDPEIIKCNAYYDNLYGYNKYNKEELFPLMDETEIEYGDSVWSRIVSFYPHSNEIQGQQKKNIGKWEEKSKQHSMVENTGGGINPTTYYFQKIKKANIGLDEEVDIHSDSFEEIDGDDPYYYVYREEAGAKESNQITDKAEAYLTKYNIFNAFISAEQEEIIEADPSERIFVNAGPGTGKTYTLIEKINYMVNWKGVNPESIQVLCFTNAAVDEVKERLNEFVNAGGTRGLVNVDVRTFHSFAWWLINKANELFVGEKGYCHINLQSLSYDGSIDKAALIIRKFASEVLGGWSHFIVDEIQDLTDIRARFVLEMVEGCLNNDVGITVFGDSCQAIYDYTQEHVLWPMSSTEFYMRLFKKMWDISSFKKLNINHRQTGRLIMITQRLREAILKNSILEMKDAVSKLQDQMEHIDGKYISLSISEKELEEIREDGKLCLLCRNNGQVLRLSSNLRKRGINHVINAYENNMNYAGWIGAVFFGYGKATISYDEFCDRFETLPIQLNCDLAWEKLQNIVGTENNRLVIRDIHQNIIRSRVDDPVLRNNESGNIIVSNIHRAKGREYQSVIVENAFINSLTGNKKKEISEYKTLYVAVTRPKSRLFAASMIRNDMRLYTIFATGRKRWLIQIGSELKFIEVRGNTDIDIASFVKGNAKEIQKYITNEIQVGDEIKLVKSKATENLFYSIVHISDKGENKIGVSTSAFIEDLEAIIQPEEFVQWPSYIDELYITGLFTHYSEEDENNVWCWVDFCGLGHIYYDIY